LPVTYPHEKLDAMQAVVGFALGTRRPSNASPNKSARRSTNPRGLHGL
jgi:hypothetical protein